MNEAGEADVCGFERNGDAADADDFDEAANASVDETGEAYSSECMVGGR